ncbi:RadC family protein [Pedobacter duraquae]|uniref:DNA replication and repair protein RadC n=1 Tax=Pedobacter duraquae TaxID=425511 RepID=A0A4R6IIX9_9SPHI|nr:DNA repair protein RadC [Pedobacter duraquae]TDO21952.1 DNA replication and repair protein RadC [Pedobacter duraquae]
MDIYAQKTGIKFWAEADRPREKLLNNGRRHLTDAELIAILLGSGSKQESAVELSRRILSFYRNDLDVLGKVSVTDLCKFKGVGEAKAVSIVAALELGRRRRESDSDCPDIKVQTAHQAYRQLWSNFADLEHEEFRMLLLNRANLLKGNFMISKGGQSGTVADPKVIFKTAIDNTASYIILAHNHPSGNANPSTEDIQLTSNLVEVGRLMDLPILDHLIITDKSFYSFSDAGLI